MADFSPASVEMTILAAGALIYAVIWFATRNLSRAAKILARVLPLGLVVPVMLYLSGSSRLAMAPRPAPDRPRKARRVNCWCKSEACMVGCPF